MSKEKALSALATKRCGKLFNNEINVVTTQIVFDNSFEIPLIDYKIRANPVQFSQPLPKYCKKTKVKIVAISTQRAAI
jgi:hypothetical protein